jgi:hypothetical protein
MHRQNLSTPEKKYITEPKHNCIAYRQAYGKRLAFGQGEREGGSPAPLR